ncbi:MAG: hypothetical protein PHD06_08630 [Bacteroidales bacterium]|jgi:hypothetical protein|nr:hypothetical protein [Bacteroidales bacterium]MDD4385228.1 hypothetical protein [Bacteroidales bacterium]MDY0198326.1 hypothetical protein [Tenuifilaceae bacterium]
MKRFVQFILFALLTPALLLAQQPPMGFTYQAVVRDLDGKPLSNQPIGVKVTLQNENGTTIHYSETATASTTSLGVVTLVVGEGEPVAGSFANVPWELGDIYISISVDAAGGNNYVSMGSAKLQSVPYALFTANNGAAVSGEGQAGRIAFWTDESTLSSLTALSYDNSFEVTSPSVAGDDDPIFEVKNRDGKVVFGVYQTGVRVYVDDTQVKGNRGGFAVGGFSDQIKEGGIDYLRITPDSARVNIRNQTGTKGNRGGFAVGGFSDQTKSQSNYLQLTPDNYFIGHEVAQNIDEGIRNSVIGYQAGYSLVNGSDNIFIGNKAGFNTGGSGLGGNENIFIGNEAGYYSASPVRNVFIGHHAGRENVGGQYNVYVGNLAGTKSSGFYNTILGGGAGSANDFGTGNVVIGYVAGRDMKSEKNVFIGMGAGYNNASTGEGGNVFIGCYAGETLSTADHRLAIASNRTTPPLIYGEFDNKKVAINSTDPSTFTLFVNGTIGNSKGFYSIFDNSNLKDSKRINDALSKIVNLIGIEYYLKEEEGGTTKQIELNAEEAIEIIPDLIDKNGEQYAINYPKLTVLLIEAIKEQQQTISNLNEVIGILKTRDDQIMQRLQQIEEQLKK